MIKLLLCGFIAGIISVAFNSVTLGLIIGIVLLTIFASINVKTIVIRKQIIIEQRNLNLKEYLNFLNTLN